MAFALGIDVGTTFTAAAIWRDSRTTVLPLGRRSDAVPTVLCLTEFGWLVGDAAERRAVTEPDRIARTFKRRMGDDVPVRVAGRNVPVVELTAEVIRWVVDRAQEAEGEAPDAVVLTHPADWGEFRTGRLRAAATAAGVPGVRLLPEPVAASCYYALRARVSPGDLIGVYDLGGGTFDASLVRKTAAGFDLVGTPVGEDTGGIDLDQEILDHVADACRAEWADLDPDDPDTLAGLAQLRGQVVLAKEALSDDREARIPVLLPGLVRRVDLTRAELEDMAGPMVDRTVAGFQGLLRRNQLAPGDIAAVLLVGGTSRMPMVAARLSAELGVRVVVDAHPKYAVCLGAAAEAATHLDRAAAQAATHLNGAAAPAPTHAQGVAAQAPTHAHGVAAPTHPDRETAPLAGAADPDTAVPRPARLADDPAATRSADPGPALPPGRPESTPDATASPRRPPPISLIADLVRSGLVERIEPAVLATVTARSAPTKALVVRTGGSGSRRPVVAAVVVGLLVLAVILVVALSHR